MGANQQNLEVEVKFYVPELAAFRERLLAVGAELIKPRVFERNVAFDTADSHLYLSRSLLRLRQDTAVTLTYKSTPKNLPKSEAKVREELEVQVSNFDTLAEILQRLGFAPVVVYEKYRETFIWQDVEIVLDELPYGNFVEFEGDESGIKTAVSYLNLNWQDRILDNYLGLMAQLKAHHDLPFNDLTFANFANQNVSIADILL
ncbi:class IV adenylate cyclase [Candidatus Leptofilum sp.]|uniref:class IV adenylate cyclase n=1 Tax=Candidatus Leptofilum sp. TaxID=3241576 RepID=UPI003B5AE91D